MAYDYSDLQGHIPQGIYDQLSSIPVIDGPLRMSHFLGQASAECMQFTHFVENLNYSGDALWSMFHTHFKDRNEAESFARQPERIANRIYSNRLGNGTEASGEGFLYRGRGTIQLTGKGNYKSFGDSIGVDLVSHPDLVATAYSLVSAAWFFTNRHIWTVCDKGIDTGTITAVTHLVNGGENGLPARIQYTQHFYSLLHGSI